MKELTIPADWGHLDRLLYFIDREMSANSQGMNSKINMEWMAEMFFALVVEHAESITTRIDAANYRLAMKAEGCESHINLSKVEDFGLHSGVTVSLAENSYQVSWK